MGWRSWMVGAAVGAATVMLTGCTTLAPMNIEVTCDGPVELYLGELDYRTGTTPRLVEAAPGDVVATYYRPQDAAVSFHVRAAGSTGDFVVVHVSAAGADGAPVTYPMTPADCP